MRQAQSSLRRELSSLRALLNSGGTEVLCSSRHAIWLDLENVWVDVLHDNDPAGGQILEGIDLRDEEEFEDWLRSVRAYYDEGFGSEQTRNVLLSDDKLPPSDDDLLPILCLHPCRPGASSEEPGISNGVDAALLDLLPRQKWVQVAIAGETDAETRSRYHLRSRCDRVAGQWFVSLVLSEAPTGAAIWTHHFAAGQEFSSSDENFLLVANTVGYLVDRQEAVARPSDTVDGILRRARVELATLRPDALSRALNLLDEIQDWGSLRVEAKITLLKADVIRCGLENWDGEAVDNLCRHATALADESPLDGRIFLSLAVLHWHRGAIDKAERFCDRALYLNPALAAALALKGSILIHKGMTDQGNELCEAASRIGANDPHHRLIHSESRHLPDIYHGSASKPEMAQAS